MPESVYCSLFYRRGLVHLLEPPVQPGSVMSRLFPSSFYHARWRQHSHSLVNDGVDSGIFAWNVLLAFAVFFYFPVIQREFLFP